MATVHIETRENRTSTSYRVRYRHPASGRMTTHGSFRRKSDANREAAKLRSSLETGTFFDESQGRKMTFAEWVAEWERRTQHRRANTAERDRLVLDSHWLPTLGEMPMHLLSPYQLTGVAADLQARMALSSLRTSVEVVTRVLKSAVDNKVIASNPASAIKVKRAPQRTVDMRFLSVAELRQLADELPAEWRVVAYLGGLLGLRWSEMLGLRLGRIDFERGKLTVCEVTTETVLHSVIERAEPKSEAGIRTLTMHRSAVEALRAHIELHELTDPDALLLTRNGAPPLRDWFRKSVYRPATVRAGVEGVTVHGLRHTAAGLLIQAGAHPEVIRMVMGHSDIRTTMRLYGRVSDETVAKSSAAVQALLDGEATPAAAWVS